MERKRHYLCLSWRLFLIIYWRAASLHFVLIVPGLDYLWFTPCFTSTHFSDAHIIPVHLFWSRGGPSFIFSRPHPSRIFCADYTRCIALIRPNPSVHDSLYHADRLIRHWVGGVSLRICAQHCPAGLLLEWLFTALMGMGLSIPSHPHRHNVEKAFQGDLVLLQLRFFTTTPASSYTILLLPGRNETWWQ